jgi:hypothetical protein
MPSKCERCGKWGYFKTVAVFERHARMWNYSKVIFVGVNCCLKPTDVTFQYIDNPKAERAAS